MNDSADYSLHYQGDLRTSMMHHRSSQVVITDAPVDNNGKGESFSPTDLVCSALASCIMTILGIKARDMGYDDVQMTANVWKTMASNPRRIGIIRGVLEIRCRRRRRHPPPRERYKYDKNSLIYRGKRNARQATGGGRNFYIRLKRARGRSGLVFNDGQTPSKELSFTSLHMPRRHQTRTFSL